MPEIGEMLRQARMHAGIDVSELEMRTKIRAKYLRALENEEWGLLPGPTFVKSFLRTYAEALGLDAKFVVEEYKLRHERLSEVEMQPIMPGPSGRERRRPRPTIPRLWLIGAGVVALLGVLLVLGLTSRTGSGSHPGARRSAPSSARPPVSPAGGATRRRRRAHRPRRVRLQLLPTGSVYVCLQAASGRKILNGVILKPGGPTPTYRSRQFAITLGNGSVRLRVNGRILPVPQVSNGVSYAVTPNGRRTLSAAKRPRCA